MVSMGIETYQVLISDNYQLILTILSAITTIVIAQCPRLHKTELNWLWTDYDYERLLFLKQSLLEINASVWGSKYSW